MSKIIISSNTLHEYLEILKIDQSAKCLISTGFYIKNEIFDNLKYNFPFGLVTGNPSLKLIYENPSTIEINIVKTLKDVKNISINYIKTKYIAFAENLKLCRLQKSINQKELAKQMNLSQGIISLFEKGLRQPTSSTLEKFCKVLNVSKEILIGEEEQMKMNNERLVLMNNIQFLTFNQIKILNKIASSFKGRVL